MGQKENKKAKEKLTLRQSFRNDIYSIRLGAAYSRRAVICALIVETLGYFEWIFFDGIFMKQVIGGLDEGKSFRQIMLFIGLSGLFFFLTNLYYNYVQSVVFPLEQTRIYGGVYSRLYNKARNVELRCYEDSDFYNRYTMAIDGADEKIVQIIEGVWGVIIGAIATAVVFVLMFRIDRFAVLFIISPLIGNFLFGNLQNKKEFQRYTKQAPNEKVINYVSRMMYLPDGAKEIRLSNIFRLMKLQFHDATRDNVKIAKRYAFPIAVLNFFRINFTFTIIFEGVLFYAIYRNLVTESISLAELTIMTSLMVACTWILIRLFENIMKLIKNGLFINNLRGFLEYEETISESQDGVMPDSDFESLEFRHVTFAYKEKEDATIRDLSFRICRNEVVALVGHNGAGKTTIIKLLLRLYDPDSGEILYNGRNIKEYNLHAYREMFATTFQDFRIFGLTVRENVLMGRHYDNEDFVVTSSLQKAGVYDKIMTLPNGIDTVMTREFDENGAVLSGGESQKIAVARTFAKNAPLKIFDEPSSALDPIAEYELFENIMKEGQDHTMMFISHRLSSVKNCDRVYMLEKGRLMEEGTHEELMKQNGSYAQMYTRQAMNYLAIEQEEEVVS